MSVRIRAPISKFNQAVLTQEPVAIFERWLPPDCWAVRQGQTPSWHKFSTQCTERQSITQQEAASLITKRSRKRVHTNEKRGAPESSFDSGSLRKLRTAIGTRYVFQPKLIESMQIMKDRWNFPIALKVSRIARVSCDSRCNYGICRRASWVWTSLAETTLESEAVGQDPVYFEDTARLTMASMITDFMNGATTSSYGPLNTLIDQVIQIPQPGKR